MVSVLADQYLSQQVGGGDALIDDVGRDRCLYQAIAVATAPLASDMTFDTEGAGLIIQLLTDIFTDPGQGAATGTACVLRLMVNIGAG